jgi:hypothetical protein
MSGKRSRYTYEIQPCEVARIILIRRVMTMWIVDQIVLSVRLCSFVLWGFLRRRLSYRAVIPYLLEFGSS